MTKEDYERAIKVLQKHNQELIAENKRLKQEPISVSVSEKEPDEISEEVTLRFFRNSLKVRWQDMVIYNVEWLKKNWQMEMDIVCGVKPCDDAVSRQAVLEVSKQHTLTDDYWALQNLPSVNPQPKTGHWKRISMDRYTTHAQYWYECDKCGEHNLGNTDFCPSCGCRMVEPRESEEEE